MVLGTSQVDGQVQAKFPVGMAMTIRVAGSPSVLGLGHGFGLNYTVLILQNGGCMSIEENKAIVRRIHEELNRGHLKIIEEFYDPAYVSHIGSRTSDLKGYRTYLENHHAAFPDWHTTIEDLFADIDYVIARVRERGTHKAPWKHHSMGRLEATHKVVESSRIIIRRFRNGKVVESWINADHLGMLHQVGAIPNAGAS
jgi:predicted ester cyclase